MKIELFNRYSGELEEEQVYGEAAIEWLYKSALGKGVNSIAKSALFSKLYGLVQDLPGSRFKIDEFCRQYNIDLDDFIPEQGRTQRNPYSTFNSFFIRQFKAGKRPFVQHEDLLPAFVEGRYLGFDHCAGKIPVKGILVEPTALLEHPRWAELFEDGPLFVGRLAPVDYHRFHFPASGEVLAQWRVQGELNSVNPIALNVHPDIFLKNERQIAIINTPQFGHLAYIEVGAVCVGKIVQTYRNRHIHRAEEKGYFLFGGSTVVVLGEKGRWKPTNDILQNSQQGIETYVHLGDQIGKRIN